MVVRDKCMNYINVSKDYFKDYISTDFETFEQYVTRKSRNGIWGDDVELQALSEIYDRAIEIYAYSS